MIIRTSVTQNVKLSPTLHTLFTELAHIKSFIGKLLRLNILTKIFNRALLTFALKEQSLTSTLKTETVFCSSVLFSPKKSCLGHETNNVLINAIQPILNHTNNAKCPRFFLTEISSSAIKNNGHFKGTTFSRNA